MDNGRSGQNSHHYNSSSRPNPPGSITGPQLGDAAHRLVANSLQLRGDHRRFTDHRNGNPPYGGTPYAPAPPLHSNRYNAASDYNRGPRPRTDHYNHGPQHQNYYGHGQPNNGPLSHHQHDRRASNHHNDRNNYQQPPPVHGYYPQESHQNEPRYPPRHAPPPPAAAAYHQGYQSLGVGGYSQWGGGDVNSYNPQGNHMGRGYDNPQRGGNRFSALSRGPNRRPPPSGDGRR